MRRLIAMILTLVTFMAAMAQNATVERMTPAPNDLTAYRYRRTDLLGRPCALVKVEMMPTDAVFTGNIVGDVKHTPGEYWVYLSSGTKMLRVQSASFMPLMVNFRDHGVNEVEPSLTYVLTISTPHSTQSAPTTAYSTVSIEEFEYEIFDENGKYGYKDKATGRVVIAAKFERGEPFINNLYPTVCVKYNGKFGFIDRNGTFIIPPEYDHAAPFSEGLARVIMNGKYGFININNYHAIPAEYDNAGYTFSEGLVAVKKNGKWGFIDKTQKTVIPAVYEDAHGFQYNRAIVKYNGKWGAINNRGQTIIPIIYDDSFIFNDGKTAKVSLNGENFNINLDGNRVN